jgi:hypothetical protein
MEIPSGYTRLLYGFHGTEDFQPCGFIKGVNLRDGPNADSQTGYYRQV